MGSGAVWKNPDRGIAEEVVEKLRFKQDREMHDFNRAVKSWKIGPRFSA
jgi:hypothetical protein